MSSLLHMSFHEIIVAVANRFLLSKLYAVVYVVVALASIGLLIWTLVKWNTTPTYWFLAMEVIITCILMFEVAVHLLALGCTAFWSSCSNCFDVAVLLFCVVSSIFLGIEVHTRRSTTGKETEEVTSIALIILRCFAQLLRIAVFMKNQRVRFKNRKIQRFDFFLREASTCDHDVDGSKEQLAGYLVENIHDEI